MTYVWDTNIIILSSKYPAFLENLDKQYNFFSGANTLYISAVSIGEVHAFALRNRWGDRRLTEMAKILKVAKPISITDDPTLIKMYAEIDVYSQSKHPTLTLATSARKMGKNDLWIAATTAVHKAILLSTDNDFNHLDGLFIAFDKIVA
jgi:tRNA(fMet)-specific endonuclease VapC